MVRSKRPRFNNLKPMYTRQAERTAMSLTETLKYMREQGYIGHDVSEAEKSARQAAGLPPVETTIPCGRRVAMVKKLNAKNEEEAARLRRVNAYLHETRALRTIAVKIQERIAATVTASELAERAAEQAAAEQAAAARAVAEEAAEADANKTDAEHVVTEEAPGTGNTNTTTSEHDNSAEDIGKSEPCAVADVAASSENQTMPPQSAGAAPNVSCSNASSATWGAWIWGYLGARNT
jgi:hypothetical protein